MNETSIRAIFKTAKSKLMKTHTSLRNNLINILTIIEEKKDKLKALEKELDSVRIKIRGGEKENSDKYNLILSNLRQRESSLLETIETHKEFLARNDNITDKYTVNILKIQNKIDEIEFNEEQTVADISLAKSTLEINELSKTGLKANYNNDDLAIIEKARKRALMALKVDEFQTDIEEELYVKGLK